MINEEKYLALSAKFLSGNASETEKTELFQWVEAKEANKRFFEEATLLWEMSEEEEDALPQIDTYTPWAKLKAQLPLAQSEGRNKPKLRKLSIWKWAAAASVIPIAFVCYMLFPTGHKPQTWTSVQTGEGETKEVKLSDGSVVVLNENSSIQFPSGSSEPESGFETRQVKLTGEAFFEVTKQNGRTFSIEAGKSRTTVLGTSFNIRAYPNEKEVEVTVVSGKVALANTQDSILLLPGEKGRTGYNAATKVLKSKAEQQNEISWKTQSLAFDNNSFREVFAALERHFQIKIHCADTALLECHYTGQYKNPNLEEILQVMQFSLDLRFEKKDDIYIVSGQGCK